MDPQKLKTQMGDLALGAAARDYQKELLAHHRAQLAVPAHEPVDLDDLMDDPELEKFHAERIASLKSQLAVYMIELFSQKDAEKRQSLVRKGHDEFREVTESDFLGEVTVTERVACHFFHQEFLRCKSGVAIDRIVGFEELGGKDDFARTTLESRLYKKGVIVKDTPEPDENGPQNCSVYHLS